MQTTNELKVTYIDHMGTDMTVVNAARASFNNGKEGKVDLVDLRLLRFLARGLSHEDWYTLVDLLADTSDRKFIEKVLWDWKTKATHFAPFCHPQISLRIEADLGTARQMWRSHVGVSGGDSGYPGWSEESRRYVDESPTFYKPDQWRLRAANVKQGSGGGVLGGEVTDYPVLAEMSSRVYCQMIDAGIAPEQARYALLCCTTTSWTWTGSLMFFARVCWLRQESHAQAEARQVADQVDKIAAGLFPYAWAALHNRDVA